MEEILEPTFGVVDGPADICYDSTGKQLLMCGDESDVRIFRNADVIDTVNYSQHRNARHGFAIASKGNCFFVGSDARCVDAYDLDSGEHICQIVSFNAEVTCVALASTGDHGIRLAAGSGDFYVKVGYFDMETRVMETCKQYVGHSAPVLSVALDPAGKILCSSSGDGTVKIWDIEKVQCLKTFDNLVPKINDYRSARQFGRMSFEPKKGNIFAVPTSGSSIHLVHREKWGILQTLSDPAFKQHAAVVAYSPCGTHLAAGLVDGTILIYKIDTGKVVRSHNSLKMLSVVKIVWDPSKPDTFAYCDDKGFVAIVGHAFKISKPSGPVEVEAVEIGLKDDDYTAKSVISDLKTDEPFEEMDLDIVESKYKPEPQYVPRPFSLKQPPFQPGSTPAAPDRDRFLVYNDMGYILAYGRDPNSDSDPAIDVHYHNQAMYSRVHVSNPDNFTLGTMNYKGYLLATECPLGKRKKTTEEPDDENVVEEDAGLKSSRIKFGTVGGENKEWTMDLEKNEWAEGVALGDNWCFVVTGRRLLRIITHAGYQQYIVSFTGPFVSIAARFRSVILVYHNGDPVDGDQNLAFSIYNMENRRMDLTVADQQLPITPGSKLSWLGFGLRNHPSTMDSKGILRIYHYQGPLAKFWSPYFNTRKHLKKKQDHYFIVSLDEESRRIRAIFCRNSDFPATIPPPTQMLLELETFQLDMTEESLKKEADFTLKRLFPPTEPEIPKLTGEVLRLFAMYCTSSLERRAMDIMQSLVPRAKDMENFASFGLANFREPLATELKKLVVDIMREECEEDIVRAPSPDLFESSQSRTHATLAPTRCNPVTPKPGPQERKPIVLSRNKRSTVEQKPSGLSRSARESFSKTPIQTIRLNDDEDDDDIIQPGLAKSIYKSMSSHNSDEETRMSPAGLSDDEAESEVDLVDREENAVLGTDADSLMMDMDRSNPFSSSDSRTGDMSVASAQTMLFDEDYSNANGSRASVEPKKSAKEPKKAAKKQPVPKPAKEDFAVPATPGYNPFRKTETVPPLTRGISTMEELTRARTVRKDLEKPMPAAADEKKKRVRKPKDENDGEPKKRGRKSGGQAKENTDMFESEPPVVKKSAPVGLARFGFTTSKTPVQAEKKEAVSGSNGAGDFIDDSDDF